MEACRKKCRLGAGKGSETGIPEPVSFPGVCPVIVSQHFGAERQRVYWLSVIEPAMVLPYIVIRVYLFEEIHFV